LAESAAVRVAWHNKIRASECYFCAARKIGRASCALKPAQSKRNPALEKLFGIIL
jgi:hypothetical protein